MSNEWDEYASEWDTDKSAQLYASLAFNEVKKAYSVKGKRIFDFGCGTGLLSEALAPEADLIVALDGSPRMIDVLKQKNLPNVEPIASFLSEELIQTSALFSEKFDMIVASSVCSFLPDYEGTAVLFSKLLAPDGVFIQWDWIAQQKESDFGLSPKCVEVALTEAGFVDVEISQPFTISSNKGDMPVLMATAVA